MSLIACTLKNSSFNVDHQDLDSIAEASAIPVCPATELHSQEGIAWIKNQLPDVIFCFGWSRLVREPLLSLPPLGVIGFHPAALPANCGRHPIIWALVLGLNQTASTFFKMDKGADSGDIVSQVMLDIHPSDNSHTLYERISNIALRQLREFVPLLASSGIQLTPQNHSLANSWRKRGPADGCIDWRMAASSIHDLVRGLSRPYIGAHFECNERIIKVWQTEIVSNTPRNLEPGKVLEVADNSLLVKAGIGAIRLLEYYPAFSVLPGEYL